MASLNELQVYFNENRLYKLLGLILVVICINSAEWDGNRTMQKLLFTSYYLEEYDITFRFCTNSRLGTNLVSIDKKKTKMKRLFSLIA